MCLLWGNSDLQRFPKHTEWRMHVQKGTRCCKACQSSYQQTHPLLISFFSCVWHHWRSLLIHVSTFKYMQAKKSTPQKEEWFQGSLVRLKRKKQIHFLTFLGGSPVKGQSCTKHERKKNFSLTSDKCNNNEILYLNQRNSKFRQLPVMAFHSQKQNLKFNQDSI